MGKVDRQLTVSPVLTIYIYNQYLQMSLCYSVYNGTSGHTEYEEGIQVGTHCSSFFILTLSPSDNYRKNWSPGEGGCSRAHQSMVS